ncbi:MAG: hypothetical protein AAB269_03705, partial [Bacteroidota bacterium]
MHALSNFEVSTGRIAPRIFLLDAIAFVFAGHLGISQSSLPLLVRLRDQAASIAQEMVGKLTVEQQVRVLVPVENSPWKTLTENAFIEALKKAGFQPVLGGGNEKELRIAVLDQSVAYQAVPAGGFQRFCRSVFEARMRGSNAMEVVTLGMFQRESID